MKRAVVFMSFLMMALFLVACGEEESTRTFEAEQGGVKSTIVYTHTGDKVTMQTAENIIPYDEIGIASKEEAEALYGPVIEPFQDIDGLTHEMKYEDTRAVESLTIDYETVSIEDLKSLPGMDFSEDNMDEVSMEKSAELLESQGFTEVEE